MEDETSSELKAADYEAAELKAAGYGAYELKTAGYTAAELKVADYAASDLKAAGYTASELEAAGYSDIVHTSTSPLKYSFSQEVTAITGTLAELGGRIRMLQDVHQAEVVESVKEALSKLDRLDDQQPIDRVAGQERATLRLASATSDLITYPREHQNNEGVDMSRESLPSVLSMAGASPFSTKPLLPSPPLELVIADTSKKLAWSGNVVQESGGDDEDDDDDDDDDDCILGSVSPKSCKSLGALRRCSVKSKLGVHAHGPAQLQSAWMDMQADSLQAGKARCTFAVKVVSDQRNARMQGSVGSRKTVNLSRTTSRKTVNMSKFEADALLARSHTSHTVSKQMHRMGSEEKLMFEYGVVSRLVVIMHPIGYPRLIWNALSLFLVAFDVLTIPLQAFDVGEEQALIIVEWIATLFWTFDLFVNFRTGYINGSNIEMRPKQIAIHYCQTWLLVDITIVIIEWINRFFGVIGSASLMRSSRAVRGIRFMKLMRLAKMQSVWGMLLEHINSNVAHLCLTMMILSVILLIAVHLMTCTWYAIGDSRSDGWVTYDAYGTHATSDIAFWYVASARWVIAQMNGRTDLDEKRNMVERFFTCLVGLTGAVLARAVFTSFVTKTMLDLSELASEKTRRRRLVNTYMERHPVHPFLVSSVKRYVNDYHDVNKDQENEDKLLAILPRHVQSELLYEVRAPILGAHPLFATLSNESAWSLHCICCEVVKTVTAVKYEVVFDKGQKCSRMFFMDKVVSTYGNPAAYKPAAYNNIDDDPADLTATFSVASLLTKGKNFAPGQNPFALLLRTGSVPRRTRVSTASLDPTASTQISGPENNDGVAVDVKVIPGTWVSEPALWVEWRNKGRLVSESHGCMYAVEANDLALGLQQKEPEAFMLAMLYAREVQEELTKHAHTSDIIAFEVDFHTKSSPLGSLGESLSLSREISKQASG